MLRLKLLLLDGFSYLRAIFYWLKSSLFYFLIVYLGLLHNSVFRFGPHRVQILGNNYFCRVLRYIYKTSEQPNIYELEELCKKEKDLISIIRFNQEDFFIVFQPKNLSMRLVKFLNRLEVSKTVFPTKMKNMGSINMDDIILSA